MSVSFQEAFRVKFALNLHFGYYFLDLKDKHLEKLRSRFPDVEFIDIQREDPLFKEKLRDADAFATWPFGIEKFREHLQHAEKLKWIQFSYVGIAPEYLNLAREKNWVLTSARGIASDSLSNHAMGLILNFERQLPRALLCQMQRKWDHQLFTRGDFGFYGLRGKILGIVGLGSIGGLLAEKASAFGMRVWGIKRDVKPVVHVEKVLPPGDLHALLRESDFVVLTLPLLENTAKIIGRDELHLMKKSAYLINIARGGLIDEPALESALHAGRIAGAALDVAATEPLSSASPLYDTPNLILTPHIAGLDRLYTDHLVDLIAWNLEKYLRGEPLKNLVDFNRGY